MKRELVLERVRRTIEKHNLIQPGDNLVVGVSGGADSVCLLHLLCYLREELGINRIAAVHVNHLYRGGEADRDQHFVESLCEKMGIPCRIYRIDVVELGKRRKISTEEAGREARYGAFSEVLSSLGGGKIAVAHHGDDQAETVLMRIFRGTGTDGLSGMDYQREPNVIRPLLAVRRKEIEDYCREAGLEFVTDGTNLKAIYSRNAVRLKLIPEANRLFGGDVSQSLWSLSEIAREDREFIASFVDEVLNKGRFSKGQAEFSFLELKELHPSVRKRVLMKAFARLGQVRDIGAAHLNEIETLMASNKTVWASDFPGGGRVKRRYDKIICEKIHMNDTETYYYEVYQSQVLSIPEGGFSMESRLLEDRESVESVKRCWFKRDRTELEQFFDYDKMEMPIQLRLRRGGEQFTPLGFSGTKKLKKYFIDEKIDRDLRGRLPLFCRGDEVLWISGVGISDLVKVDETTRRVLVLRVQKETVSR